MEWGRKRLAGVAGVAERAAATGAHELRWQQLAQPAHGPGAPEQHLPGAPQLTRHAAHAGHVRQALLTWLQTGLGQPLSLRLPGGMWIYMVDYGGLHLWPIAHSL